MALGVRQRFLVQYAEFEAKSRKSGFAIRRSMSEDDSKPWCSGRMPCRSDGPCPSPGRSRDSVTVRERARARSVYDRPNAPLGGKENKFEGMMLDCKCPSAIAYAMKIIHQAG